MKTVGDILMHCSGIVDEDTHIVLLRTTDSGAECVAYGRKYATDITARYSMEAKQATYFTDENGLAIWITH